MVFVVVNVVGVVDVLIGVFLFFVCWLVLLLLFLNNEDDNKL